MARNIEIKAYAHSFADQLELARDLADTEAELLIQKDTFFNSKSGRLKLREFPNGPAQLIFYRRGNSAGPKLSEYHITETNDPKGLTTTLRGAYGIKVEVRKKRTLYLCGQTRLHFDDVEGLGQFIELEVVLHSDQSIREGEALASELMQELNIRQADLVETAYADLLLAKTQA